MFYRKQQAREFNTLPKASIRNKTRPKRNYKLRMIHKLLCSFFNECHYRFPFLLQVTIEHVDPEFMLRKFIPKIECKQRTKQIKTGFSKQNRGEREKPQSFIDASIEVLKVLEKGLKSFFILLKFIYAARRLTH